MTGERDGVENVMVWWWYRERDGVWERDVLGVWLQTLIRLGATALLGVAQRYYPVSYCLTTVRIGP